MVSGGLEFIYLAVQGSKMDNGREILNESHSRHARGRIRGYMLSLLGHGDWTTYHRLVRSDSRSLI
jgi:hypothetical protein